MSLKITLKPGERMIVGGAVITNGNTKAGFTIDNHVPILRDKDILGPSNVQTPARRIYFAIQLMYIDEDHLAAHHQLYWKLVKSFLDAAPRALGIIDRISEDIVNRSYYQALKTCKRLIAYEEEVIAGVQ